MPVHNAEIARLFEQLADLLEVEDANPFRVRAYRNAARTVSNNSKSMADLLAGGKDLSKLPGIGKDLAEKIRTIVETGRLPLLEEVRARTPAALSDLMKIEGLGSKRVKVLYSQLHITCPEDLQRAARSGRIRELEGFGRKTEEMILHRLEHFGDAQARTRLVDAEETVKPLLAYLQATRGIKDIVVAGSFRRRSETVGDLDILATASRGSPVMDRFVAYDQVAEVISSGKTRATVVLRSGLHVDLRVVPQASYGAALCYFTGSRAHNIAIRKIGVRKGYKINEYGVFRHDKRIAGKTEKSVYRQVGLPCIEPELRENSGEIEAAGKNRLPRLVSVDDIRGDLHCHTRASDGHDSLEEMVTAARAKGYEYIAITDHSKRLTVAHGLDEKRLLREIGQIDRLNDKLDDIVILKGIEVDILEDGTLDIQDKLLGQLDLVVGAVHYKFNLTRRKQTERIIRAMDNPYFNILAHPTARLINERAASEMDMEKVMTAARERGCFLEVNAQPVRLDLTDSHCRLAREAGLRVAISTDAHSTKGLDHMRFGIDQARRGWLEAADVLNTCKLPDLRKLLTR
ncbi:MAG: DNA polymerase/3'-5' exonuclease PolX [Halobacteria archaeon]|nr:DNA polymerase/3'-5' exonuclease PolX [Halobacteria archaeon]